VPSPASRIDPRLRRQAPRFVAVGASVAIIYAGLTALLAGPFGLPVQAAVAVGYGVGVVANFTLHRSVTFASEDGYDLHIAGQIIRFLALALLQYGVTAAAIAWLPGLLGLPEIVVWGCVVVTFALANFVALRLTAFRPART